MKIPWPPANHNQQRKTLNHSIPIPVQNKYGYNFPMATSTYHCGSFQGNSATIKHIPPYSFLHVLTPTHSPSTQPALLLHSSPSPHSPKHPPQRPSQSSTPTTDSKTNHVVPPGCRRLPPLEGGTLSAFCLETNILLPTLTGRLVHPLPPPTAMAATVLWIWQTIAKHSKSLCQCQTSINLLWEGKYKGFKLI